jgi:hypothetical protein
LLIAAVPAARSAEQTASGPSCARQLLGAWQEVRAEPTLDQEGREADLILFEESRLTRLSAGRYRVLPVRYRADGFLYREMAAFRNAAVAVGGDELKLTLGAERKSFKRLPEVPQKLRLKAMTLGRAAKLDKKRIAEIRAELGKRGRDDQAVRRNRARHKDGPRVTAENSRYLKDLVGKIGWIDCSRFGKRASRNAFLIVQHSCDLPMMMAALPEIEKDARARRIDGARYAMLYDRVQILLGKQQKFGTQIGMDEKGKIRVLPLVDRKSVDKFRRQLGMTSLQRYMRMFVNSEGERASFMEAWPEDGRDKAHRNPQRKDAGGEGP